MGIRWGAKTDYDLSVPTGRLHRGFFDDIARANIWA
jgi:hypothetical protein